MPLAATHERLTDPADASLAVQLRDADLARSSAYIGGAWQDAHGGRSYSVVNPATQSALGTVPDMRAEETAQAITEAHAAFPTWRAQTALQRGNILRRWADLIVANADDLGRIMTLEQGKPFAEARSEVIYAASFLTWYAEEARRAGGEIIQPPAADRRFLVIREPVGVVGCITPWNFPAAMITRKAGPAIAAGCTVVLKPAEVTPYSALAMAELAHRAGLPPGVLNIVTSANSRSVGSVLTSDARVRKLSFTGSTEVGRVLMAQCAPTIKKLSLELGGNAPFIVFDDADIEAAVQGAMASKFRNSGQTCVCANRLFVHDAVYDRFIARFAEEIAKLRCGNGLEPGVTQGPLIDAEALQKVQGHVADALSKGGKLVQGGKPHPLGGTFFEPTLIAEASRDMRCVVEETFGPVAPVIRFRTDQEVIELANDTEYGLAAYFFSRDIGRIWRVAEALEYGMVGINTGIISSETVPFGGIKQSGLGREGGRQGLEDFLETKYLCMGGLEGVPQHG